MPACNERSCQRLRMAGLLLLALAAVSKERVRAQVVDPPRAPSPGDQELESVTRMLDLAWSGDAQAPQAVRQLYESLRGEVLSRARWHYAYGIACLKMKRYSAASLAFQSAIKESKSFPFSAWKGLIWSELAQKRYDPGLAQIESFARAVVDENFSGTSEEKDAAAVWIGQTMGALDKVVTIPKARQRIDETNTKLQEIWPAELREAEQSGRDYTDVLYAELTDELKQATDQAKAREEGEKQEQQKKLSDKSAAAEKQREELKKMGEELQKQGKERLEQIDKQLERLERDYGYLQARSQSVLQSMMLAQNQSMIAQQAGTSNSQALGMGGQRHDLMLTMYQQEYEMNLIRGTMTVQRALETLQTRERLVQQLRQASDDLKEEDANLGKWQERLKGNSQNLQKQKLKGKSPSVREKRMRAKTLSTYLEFDPEWERIHLTEQPENS